MNNLQHLSEKTAFLFYNLIWKIAIPLLRHNHRLADGFRERTLSIKPKPADIWIQAASAGEAYITLTLLNALKFDKPVRILLTANTRQGIDILKKGASELQQDKIKIFTAFFPFDKPDLMESAVKQVSPKIMILMETEMWPAHLFALKKHGTKILIINGRLTEKSLKQYLILPSVWQKIKPDRICAVSSADASRFISLFGQDSAEIMPNIKFDKINNTGDLSDKKKQIKKLLTDKTSFIVFGSVRGEEEADIYKILLKVFCKAPKTVAGFFPRHLHRIDEIKKGLKRFSIKLILRSEIAEPVPAGTVIIWDVFGELGAAYEMAKAAFVGGSLAPLGGQNFLEPLATGIIPVTGPFWDNFKWIGDEIFQQGLVKKTSGWEETALVLIKNLESPESRGKIQKAAENYVKERQGGAAIASRIIHELYQKKL